MRRLSGSRARAHIIFNCGGLACRHIKSSDRKDAHLRSFAAIQGSGLGGRARAGASRPGMYGFYSTRIHRTLSIGAGGTYGCASRTPIDAPSNLSTASDVDTRRCRS